MFYTLIVYVILETTAPVQVSKIPVDTFSKIEECEKVGDRVVDTAYTLTVLGFTCERQH